MRGWKLLQFWTTAAVTLAVKDTVDLYIQIESCEMNSHDIINHVILGNVSFKASGLRQNLVDLKISRLNWVLTHWEDVSWKMMDVFQHRCDTYKEHLEITLALETFIKKK